MRVVLTSVLDLLGLLLLVAAVVLLVGAWSVPGAAAAGGVGLLGVSWLTDKMADRRTKR